MLLHILILEDGTDMLCQNVDSKLSVCGVQQYRRQKITAKLAYMYHSQYNTTTIATTTTTNTTTITTTTTTDDNNNNNNNNHEVKELQKTAILGTAHILRKALM